MKRTSRRAALGAILSAPLASVSATAMPPAVSPDLSRLIAKHDRLAAMLNEASDAGDPSRGLIRAAGRVRARITGFASAGLADTLAKAACLGRLWPLSEAQDEVRYAVEKGHVHLEDMALCIAVEVMQMAEGKPCA